MAPGTEVTATIGEQIHREGGQFGQGGGGSRWIVGLLIFFVMQVGSCKHLDPPGYADVDSMTLHLSMCQLLVLASAHHAKKRKRFHFGIPAMEIHRSLRWGG